MSHLAYKLDTLSALKKLIIYSAIKTEWNDAICRNMDGPSNYHTKWTKSERKRQILYDITFM